MTLRDRIPRRLPSQVWLLTLPSALISFERRQAIRQLPIGAFRYAGVPLIALGVALGVWAWRNPKATKGYQGAAERLVRRPSTLAGLLVIGGAGLLSRSAILTLYTLGIAVAASTETIEIEDPRPAELLETSFN